MFSFVTRLFKKTSISRRPGAQTAGPLGYNFNSAANVSPDTSMQISVVWACVRLLAETVAGLPLAFWTVENGIKKAADNDLSRLFSGKPNRYQTRIEFFETVMLNLVLYGNAYCRITRSGGRIVSLLPLMSSQVNVELEEDGSLVYYYEDDNNVVAIAPENVWHLRLFGNGIVGLSPLDYARNSIGTASAAEARISKIMANANKASGVLTIDKTLTEPQRQKIRESFKSLTEGGDDSLYVLEAAMKFQQISLSPKDVELLETRKFQIEDLCRFFGVNPVLIGVSGATTWGTGIQEIMRGFYKLVIRPYLEKLEASIKENLLSPADRRSVEPEFDFNALLTLSDNERAVMLKEKVQSGQITPNEARLSEGREPVEGGDQLFMQAQMTPITMLGRQPAPTQPIQSNQG